MEETKEVLPYLNNLLLIRKADGGTRCCLDLRHTNKFTETESYTIPLIEDLFLAVATNQGQELCFTLLDLYSAYNQLWLEKSSRKYTGFMHPDQNRGSRVPESFRVHPTVWLHIREEWQRSFST